MTTVKEKNTLAVEQDKTTRVEIQKEPSSYLEYLQQALENNGIEKIKNTLQRKVRATNLIVDDFLLEDNEDGFSRDFNLSLDNLYILKSLNLLEQVLQMQIKEVERFRTKDIEVEIDHYGSYRFSMALVDDSNLYAKKQAIRKELAGGVFWKIFTQLCKEHIPGTTTSIPEQTFKLTDNPQLNALYLFCLNLIPNGYRLDDQLKQESIEDVSEKLLLEACQKHALFNDEGIIEKIVFNLNNGIELTLTPANDPVNLNNLLAGNWQLAITSSLETNILEEANQNPELQYKVFINRPTGIKLIEAVEHAKLKFSRDFEAFLIGKINHIFNDRYGQAYTHISRLLAKILWSGDLSKISSIFVNQENMTPKSEDLKALAEYPNQDQGLCALQDILLQLLERDEANQISDIEMTKEAIQLSDGTCFDVTTYYCLALKSGNLYQKIINGKLFLLKTLGSNTFINLTPVWFNGIQLPKGSLFASIDNDQFAFLRLTPFVFDNREDMLSTFGTEIIKAESLGENAMDVVDYMNHI